jgi:plasmid stabilization system protein ParE
MAGYTIKWNRSAKSELKSIYRHYLKETVQGAESVRDGILEAVDKLGVEPEVNYPYEPYLGKPFRYIKYARYKIVHKKDTENEEIHVLGIFDTKQEPKKIQKIGNRR